MTAARITRSGADHWTGTRPQTDAQRIYRDGPLVTAEPRPILPRIGLALVLATIAAAWALDTPPAASSGHPEAQHAPAADAGGGNGEATLSD